MAKEVPQQPLPSAPGPRSATGRAVQCGTRGEPLPVLRPRQRHGELEELWRAAFECNPTMYFIVDAAGLIVSVNRFGAQQLGYAVDELVGQPVLKVFHEADRAFVQAQAHACFREPGRSQRWEARKIRQDGSMLWVRETANAVLLRDRPVLLVACEDVTERRQAEEALRDSEERFRTLVQFSFDVYWETDAQHRFVRQEFGPTLADAPPRDSELGKTRWEVPYLEPDEEVWRKHRETLDAHLPFRDFELARPAADGGKRYVSVSGLPVFDAAGEFVGYRGVGRHITARKRAEETLRMHLWFLESMDRINRAIQGTSDLERTMSDVLDAVLELFACDRAWLVYPCDPDAPAWRALMEHTRPQFPGAFAIGADRPLSPELASMFRTLLAAQGAVMFGPGYDLAIPEPVAREFAVQSQMAFVVRPKTGRPYLFGVHQCSHPRVWSEQEIRLFEEIGRRLDHVLTSLLIFRSLRESERKLEEAQRIGRMGYFEYELGSERLALSDEACRICGIEQRDLPAWHGRALELVHPEDREKLVDTILAASCGSGNFEMEFRAQRPDGGVRIVQSRGEATPGTPPARLRAFGTLQDVTELRQAQQELSASELLTRHIFETAPDGMAVIGRGGRYQRVNPACERSWAMPASQIVGRRVADLFGADVYEQTLKPHLERCFAGEQVAFAEWLTNARGRVYYSVKYAPLRWERGRVETVLAITRDLTEHMLAAEALRDAEAALARVNRVTTLGVLAASIAHEVNQPLGAMITSAASCTRWLAAEPPRMDKARSALQRIVADGRRAGQVVDHIRALVNRQAPRRAPVELAEAVAEVIALTRAEMRRNAIALETSLAPDLPRIECDRVQVQQVVLNLVVNAIEALGASDAGPRRLAVTCARDGPAALAVEVRDSGPGIDPAQAERLFEAFYTTKDDGIGMGLSISRSIIEAHGGRLAVAPNVPHGATFRFSLPVRQAGP